MLCCKFVYFVFSTVIYFNWNALIVAQANKEWDLFALLNANEPPPHPEKKGNALNKRHRGLQPSEGKMKSPQVTVLLQVSQTGCISGVGQNEIIALRFELKPHVSSDNRILNSALLLCRNSAKFLHLWQTMYYLCSSGFSYRDRRICSHQRALIHETLLFKANKRSYMLSCACAADFSHNDDSNYTHASH